MNEEIDEKLVSLADHLHAAQKVCEELLAAKTSGNLAAYLKRMRKHLTRLVTYAGQFDLKATERMNIPLRELLGDELFAHLCEKDEEHRRAPRQPQGEYCCPKPIAKKCVFLGDLIESNDSGWRCYVLTQDKWEGSSGTYWEWRKTKCDACEAICTKVSTAGIGIQTGKDSPLN